MAKSERIDSMQCIEEESLLEYSEGDLQGPALEAVERHLENCDRCRNELSLLRRSWECLEAWQPIEPSPILRARVWEEIRLSPQAAPASLSTTWTTWLRGVSLALAGLACAFFCLFHLNILFPGTPAVIPTAEVARQVPPKEEEELVAMDWQLDDVGAFGEPEVPHDEVGGDVKLGRISHHLMEGTHEALLEVAGDRS